MSAEALQIGVYNALESASLGVIGIYDNPQQVPDPDNNALFPFVTVGDSTISQWDTDTELGVEATVRVHVWSRAHHHLECKAIQESIYNTLHRGNIVVSGYRVINIRRTVQEAQRDPDGITIHGVQQFIVLMQEE